MQLKDQVFCRFHMVCTDCFLPVRCGRRAGHIPQLLLVPPTFLANSWIRIRSETPVTLQFRSCQKSKTDAGGGGGGGGMQCIHHIVPQKHSFQNWGEEKKGKKLSGSSSSLTLKEEFQLLVFLLQYPKSPLTSLS